MQFKCATVDCLLFPKSLIKQLNTTAQGSAWLSYLSRGVTIAPAEALSASVQVEKVTSSSLSPHVLLYYDPVTSTLRLTK